MTGVRTAIVVGAGVAGTAAALALQKAGIEPVVHEARAQSADETGIMLTLATNGIAALRTLDADGPVLAHGFATPGIELRSTTGKALGVTATGSSRADAAPSRTLRRADLYRALRDVAQDRGIRVENDHRLVSAEQTADGVRAVFADGSEAVADVLIGADGIHSAVRGVIDPAAPPPAYSGLITTGGYARGVDTGTAPGRYEMIFGRRAFFGHATAPDGEVWWFVNVPRRREPARGELRAVTTERWRERLNDLVADDAGPALPIIAATDDFPPMTPIHTVRSLPTWHRGRMVVIGDAAHAPSPTSGQGASLSVEDAVVLAVCLRDVPDAPAALRTFEKIRRPRAERIVKGAARINNNKAAGPVGRVLRDAMLPAILKMTAGSAANAETFDHRIDWDAPIAPIG